MSAFSQPNSVGSAEHASHHSVEHSSWRRPDRILTPPAVHGGGRKPEPDLDLKKLAPLFAEFNRGTQRAIRANWDREAREKHLDSLYYWGDLIG